MSISPLIGRQLNYRIRNRSDQVLSIRLIPDRDMHYIIKDQANDNAIYNAGLTFIPHQSAFVGFAITGKSSTWGAIKKHWGIKEIHVEAQALQPHSLPYTQIIQLDEKDSRRELTLTITNPTEIGSDKVVIEYE